MTDSAHLKKLEDTEVADKLTRKGVEIPLQGPESFCGIRNVFMPATLENKGEWLMESPWASLPAMEVFRVLTGDTNSSH